jgi:3-oxoadipate enol-lactonase
MAKARINGVETSYDVKGQGYPVLFIHGGFGGPGSTLVPQVRRVLDVFPEDRVQTIVYDRRCAGMTEYDLSHYTVLDLAADARALLDHLGIDRSIVVGDSMGGMVAQQYALAYPEGVVALCLLETGADLMSETEFGKRGQYLVQRAATEGEREVFDSYKEELRNPPRPNTSALSPEERTRAELQRAVMLAVLSAIPDEELFRYATGLLRNFEAFIGYDFAARLTELKMPVCVIHGDIDTTVPFEYGRALHDAIPQSEFHEIADATHGLLIYPDAVDTLRDWVLRIADQAA